MQSLKWTLKKTDIKHCASRSNVDSVIDKLDEIHDCKSIADAPLTEKASSLKVGVI